jgi:aminopeptidase N
MKKTKIHKIFLLLFLFNSLFAQEIPFHKKGLKYDFRILAETPEHNINILHYRFDWKINVDSQYIQGKASVTARSLIHDLDKITLHLADNMEVREITQNQSALDFYHQQDLLDIYLAQSQNPDDVFEVEIAYQGYPESGLNFSHHQNQPIVWSLDEPISAREWFPCYDLPSDKATAEMRVTVPDEMIVASNGNLVNVIDNLDDTVTYIWKENYPIATYLISIAATNYDTFSDYYSWGSENMEVIYYVYPEDLLLAQEDFSITVSMIEFYSQAFGEYPFLEEKYGMAEIPRNTAMEHQTCTSYPSRTITGNHEYDWLIAHELAHQWWGDLVTLAEWADIWLNEGFATYSDALWQEHLYGSEGLKARMADFKYIYFNQHPGQEHSIHNPPEGHLFCEIVYEKAAWVLHMLRFVVGDEAFWKILKKYAQDYAYSTVTTDDFRQVCEEIYGADLGWFFNQWIFEAGYPTYEFGWGSLGQNEVRVVIRQIQEDFPTFIMPVELQFNFPSGTVKEIVWVDEKNNNFDFLFQEKPVEVLFDPDTWILGEVENYQKNAKRRR